jgi:type IV secretion system protein VirB6
MSCVAPQTGAGFLEATLFNLDCQAQTIGEAGYLALGIFGSPLSATLTLLITLFIALIGFRFLTNKPLALDEWIAAALKVGFVITLAASWPAYRTIVYDVVLKAPAELSTSIGRAAALPGSIGGLYARLQAVDNGIMTFVEAGSGRFDNEAQQVEGAIAPPVADSMAIGWAKTLYVSSLIGSFGILRLMGGLLLALAPFFAGFLLFDATRFLFSGWVRSLFAIALGSIGLAVVLGVKLAIIEPWLSQVLELRTAQIATVSAPFELLALSLAFSIVMLGVFILALRIGFSVSVITKIQTGLERAAQNLYNEHQTSTASHMQMMNNYKEQSRAQLIAQSLQHAEQRQMQSTNIRNDTLNMQGRGLEIANAQIARETNENVPLGRSYPLPSRRVGAQSIRQTPLS